MLLTRLWRCDGWLFPVVFACGGASVGCFPWGAPLRSVLPSLAPAFHVLFSYLPLFASVLSCLRYFVMVNGGLYPFIFQGFLLY